MTEKTQGRRAHIKVESMTALPASMQRLIVSVAEGMGNLRTDKVVGIVQITKDGFLRIPDLTAALILRNPANPSIEDDAMNCFRGLLATFESGQDVIGMITDAGIFAATVEILRSRGARDETRN